MGERAHRRLPRLAWLAAGSLCLAAGVIGIVLPLLPTTPFLLLAAFCFGRGSQRVHDWLLAHPRLGPPIEAWRRYGAISRRSKILAAAAMAAAFGASIILGAPRFALVAQAIVLVAVGSFIFTRPAPPLARIAAIED